MMRRMSEWLQDSHFCSCCCKRLKMSVAHNPRQENDCSRAWRGSAGVTPAWIQTCRTSFSCSECLSRRVVEARLERGSISESYAWIYDSFLCANIKGY